MRHAGDDADFTAAIRIGPALGDFTGVVGFGFDAQKMASDCQQKKLKGCE